MEYCYGVIGCIVIDDSWYNDLYRRVNLEPNSREKINTRFILHTREFPSHVKLLVDHHICIQYVIILLVSLGYNALC